jgi:hypothetical protein
MSFILIKEQIDQEKHDKKQVLLQHEHEHEHNMVFSCFGGIVAVNNSPTL